MRITITRDDKRQIETHVHGDPARANPLVGTMAPWGGAAYFLKPDGSGKWRTLDEPEGTWHKCSWHESIPRW